ncbi:hypothetical protein [Rhizobium leguminosarum]|uniref:hypothetical protein n=1 Tax=Rhizobium leguminosarum TaxID=384 RepID=UPI001C966AD4|nr:hypothetical protein [Rhizobium leguminosarum]MBY5666631.1 hypothetical protein [Rhizobium leguminosarum]MBY5680082.1 hypothetical protein [Rhizobium leguminosarum]
MALLIRMLLLLVIITKNTTVAFAADGIENKIQSITETLATLCLAGGTETAFTAKGNAELRSKLKDVLTGNVGAAVEGETTFSKHAWQGIIGGISKEMTSVQSEQANEARKCMVDHGFDLVNKFLASQ